jgi:hypothetical protein
MHFAALEDILHLQVYLVFYLQEHHVLYRQRFYQRPSSLTTTLGHYGGRVLRRGQIGLIILKSIRPLRNRKRETQSTSALGLNSGPERSTCQFCLGLLWYTCTDLSQQFFGALLQGSTCRTLLIQWCEILLQSPCGVPNPAIFNSVRKKSTHRTMLGSRRTNRGVFMHSTVSRSIHIG